MRGVRKRIDGGLGENEGKKESTGEEREGRKESGGKEEEGRKESGEE
jgi:hypothetical protein